MHEQNLSTVIVGDNRKLSKEFYLLFPWRCILGL